MPFGTSTKERLCTEMNNYPQNANIRAGGGQLLWITLWTMWIICGHTRFVKAKSAKNTVDNPVETVDAFAQFETI